VSKLWGGRFAKGTEAVVEGFTSSLSFDRRLYRQDIRGSIAHARMLAATGIIAREEAEPIIVGLREIQEEIESGAFPFRQEYEDIHLNIEKRLIEKIGPVGGKLHTARSRNDQVATDVHLFIKEEIAAVQALISGLQAALLEQAKDNVGVIMPGYTHLQRAQPILFAHHLMAYFFMLERDFGRYADCLKRTDISPLGAGALAGTTFPIDREMAAWDLGFAGVYPNSLDAVSDRDFLIEFLSASSVTMMHLSRLCEELIIWSTTEFGFIEMDDGFSTGSSIMPQKKNPDVAELIRGKTGRVYGNLMALLTVLKGLPLAYHSDLQEDKERVFDTIDTVKACLALAAGMVATMKVKHGTMREAVRQDFSNATDLADYLAKRGMPFREAHEVVGKAVLHCLNRGIFLADLTIEEFKGFSDLIAEDVYGAISPEACVAGRHSLGGTAPDQVERQLRIARGILRERGAEVPLG
jgi:argininosuccinate lyase